MTAVRVDSESGIETRIDQLKSPQGYIYVVDTRPPGASACVVICSSVFADFHSNYHRERALALALATRGIGSVRFHYTGEGNSQGERGEMTFQTLCSDATVAYDHASQGGFTNIGLLGTRVGSLVAAKVAAGAPAAPLALWQPVVSPYRLVAEGFRAKRMSMLAGENGSQPRDWQTELAESGYVDILGYDVHRAYIDSIQPVNLLDLLGHEPRPILVAYFHPQHEGLESLPTTLEERGLSVTQRTFDLSEAWWFDRDDRPNSADLIPATTDWMDAVLKLGSARGTE